MENVNTSRRRSSILGSGVAQFSGQALGLVLALVVSHLIARRIGVGAEADAFLLGRRLITAVTEALNQVIVVVFIPLIAAQAAAGFSIWRIVLRSGGGAVLTGVALGVAFLLGAPWIVASVAPDFSAGTAALATKVVVILSIALPATTATIALAAYCNVQGHFGAAATTRQLPRAAVAGALMVGSSGLAVLAASAYTVGAFAVTAITLWLALRLSRTSQISSAPAEQKSSASRHGSAAIILAGGAMIALWLETAVAAANGSGAVAMLDYAQRLGALLGNTLAMALTLVVFADMSRRLTVRDTADLGPLFQVALGTGLALMLPVTVGIIVNAPAIVEVILGYGAFAEAGMREQVILLTRWMAVAPIGALGARMMYVRVIAQKDLPIVRVIGASMFADIVFRILLFWLLTPLIGLTAIPIALTIAPIAPMLVMAFMLRGRRLFSGRVSARAMRPLLIASLATCIAITIGGVVGVDLVKGLVASGSKVSALSGLLVSALAGAAVLAVAVVGFRVRPALE